MEKIEKALEEAKKNLDTTEGAALQSEAGVEEAPGEAGRVKLDHDALVRKRVIAGPCGAALTDYYKVLRTQIEQRVLCGEGNTLMVTSAMDGEGKSLTALNMAISFAQEIDRTVLLVEADLRNPSLKDLMGLDPGLPGLADYLLDGRPIQDLLLRFKKSKLVILPAGRSVPNSPELLGSQRMKDLVLNLKGRNSNRLILFDTPPLLGPADAIVFSEFVDAIVMVAEAGKTSEAKIKKARDLLAGRNVIGVILNKTRQDKTIQV
ncbi:polysaccharide biosynthesis tyrosine autokinase [Thermodesulfobacteriota bacterium]